MNIKAEVLTRGRIWVKHEITYDTTESLHNDKCLFFKEMNIYWFICVSVES